MKVDAMQQELVTEGTAQQTTARQPQRLLACDGFVGWR
jgi:hypothetical protein